MKNTEQFQQDENFSSPQPVVLSKRWLVVLAIILGVMMVAVVGLIYFSEKNKSRITPPLPPLENGGSAGLPEKLVRQGKMVLQSDKKQLKVGETFKVDILMDTQNSNIVVASAQIIYDPTVLKLVKVDEENSALSMAVIENQESGLVEIIRGAPGDADYDDSDDGYNGSDGKLASLEFKALKKASTEIKFKPEESNMILDDGRGTGMVVEYEGAVVNVE